MFNVTVCAQSWGLTSAWPQKVMQPTKRTLKTTVSLRETPPTRAGHLPSPLTMIQWPRQESARSVPPSHTSPIMHSALWAWSWAGWSWRPIGSHKHLPWLHTSTTNQAKSFHLFSFYVVLVTLFIIQFLLVKINKSSCCVSSYLFVSRLLEQLLEKEREYQAILQQVLEEREQEIRLLRLRSEPAGPNIYQIFLIYCRCYCHYHHY